MTSRASQYVIQPLGPLRAALASGFTGLILFVLCWIVAEIGNLNPAHMFVQLFTNAPIRSVRALLEGGLWVSTFGVLAGFIGAASSNFVQARQPL